MVLSGSGDRWPTATYTTFLSGYSRLTQKVEADEDVQALAKQVLALTGKVEAMEGRMVVVERLETQLEESALQTTRALEEISRHWDGHAYCLPCRVNRGTARPDGSPIESKRPIVSRRRKAHPQGPFEERALVLLDAARHLNLAVERSRLARPALELAAATWRAAVAQESGYAQAANGILSLEPQTESDDGSRAWPYVVGQDPNVGDIQLHFTLPDGAVDIFYLGE